MSRSTKIGSDSQAPAPWLLTILIASSIAVQHVVHGAVQVGFYDATCSAAESIVKGAVQSAVALDGTIAASIIRLHFHDCFAQVRGSWHRNPEIHVANFTASRTRCVPCRLHSERIGAQSWWIAHCCVFANCSQILSGRFRVAMHPSCSPERARSEMHRRTYL